MEGLITTFTGTSLTVNVDLVGGSGTFASWTITATGVVGPTGSQGIQGVTGPQGPQGIQGVTGTNGAVGATGAQGPQGPQGATGNTGLSYAALTSSTSQAVGAGIRSFGTNLSATQTAFSVGERVRVFNTANPSNFMEGPISTFTGNSLDVNIDSWGGSGTYTSWKISTAGSRGPTGETGPQGPQGPQGIQGATGTNGAVGATGNIGPIGPTGPQGTTGLGYAALTSTTSYAVGTGIRTFTTNLSATQTAFAVGQRVRVSNPATPSNFMEGPISTFTGTALSVNVDYTGGSGTYTSWNISAAPGPVGSTGATGATGAKGDTGATGATGMAFIVYAVVDSSTNLPVLANYTPYIGQYVLAKGGYMFRIEGSGLGTQGPNNAYTAQGDLLDENQLKGSTGPTGPKITGATASKVGTLVTVTFSLEDSTTVSCNFNV